MILYVEKRAEEYPLTQRILQKFPHSQVLIIDHYKNIFDKNIQNYKLGSAIILAKDTNLSLLSAPENYGYPWKSYFFRSSLNCVFDCEYCYLKGNFKTQYPVIFVNYEDIQQEIERKIYEERNSGYQGNLTFYSSNYSDVQALDGISEFNASFVPFFEKFENVLMETRTKSHSIDSFFLINWGKPFNNTEISFSLNPQEIISCFEKGTSSLEERIYAINTLTNRGYKVGLRFLPLLPVDWYQEIYKDFLKNLCGKINVDAINSVFIASLIYNQGDFKNMQKKNPTSLLWNLLMLHENWLMKISDDVFQNFVSLFKEAFPGKNIFVDYV